MYILTYKKERKNQSWWKGVTTHGCTSGWHEMTLHILSVYLCNRV